MEASPEWRDQELDAAQACLQSGSQAMRRRDLGAAEHFLSEALALLAMTEEASDRTLEVKAQTLNEFGFLRQRQERMDEAAELHRESVDLCETIVERGLDFHQNLMATRINLSSVVAAGGDLSSAREIAQAAVDGAEHVEDGPDVVFGAYHNLSVLCARSDDNKSSEEWMSRAIEVFEQTEGDVRSNMIVQAAQGCQQVSVVMFHNKSFEEALRWGKAAETLSEEAHATHGDAAITVYVTSQINLISYYEKAGEFAAAEDALWKAIDVVGPHEEIFKRGEAFYQTCRKQADARLEKVGLTRPEVEEGYEELKERIRQSKMAPPAEPSEDGETAP